MWPALLLLCSVHAWNAVDMHTLTPAHPRAQWCSEVNMSNSGEVHAAVVHMLADAMDLVLETDEKIMGYSPEYKLRAPCVAFICMQAASSLNISAMKIPGKPNCTPLFIINPHLHKTLLTGYVISFTFLEHTIECERIAECRKQYVWRIRDHSTLLTALAVPPRDMGTLDFVVGSLSTSP